METKRCPRCGHDKPLSDFPPRSDRPAGVMSRCHDCDNARSRAYYQANREKKLARYQANREKVLARYRAHRTKAVAIYGGCCEQCGGAENLEFDHPDWDGEEHRTVESHQAMYRRIAESGQRLPDRRVRLLCRRCHHQRVRPLSAS